MSFLGFIVQSMIALFLVYKGYYYEQSSMEMTGALILACPILFMIGSAIRHNAKSKNRLGFFGAIKLVIVSYGTGLVLSAIFFGIGIGLQHLLELRPPPGTGRY